MSNITAWGYNTTVSQMGYLGNEIFGDPLLIGFFLLAFLGLITLRSGGGMPLFLIIMLPGALVLSTSLLPVPLMVVILLIELFIIATGLLTLLT